MKVPSLDPRVFFFQCPNGPLKVYTSIFPKLLTLPFSLEIIYMRVFKFLELDYEREITLEISIHVDFTEKVNLSFLFRKFSRVNEFSSIFSGFATFLKLIFGDSKWW